MNRQISKFGFHFPGRLAGIGLLLAFLLGACGSAPAAASPPTEDVRSAVNTAVAASVTAWVVPSATPTLTPSPTVTPTPSRTPTKNPATATSIWGRDYSPYYTCADSAFVKDVTIPDGTVLAPGEVFVKTWRFRNTGSCTWNADYSLVFVKGSNMGGTSVDLGQSVKVNKNADLSITLVAPYKEGTYTGYWKLQDEYGYTFGDLVYVQIVVANGVISVTSTPTATPISISTSVPPGP
ncbi:MAG: NBR1-Ig-like domain-containing protein [Chloroflexota bacterium]